MSASEQPIDLESVIVSALRDARNDLSDIDMVEIAAFGDQHAFETGEIVATILKEAGIECSIGGSIVYGISVHVRDSKRAITILQVEPRLVGRRIICKYKEEDRK